MTTARNLAIRWPSMVLAAALVLPMLLAAACDDDPSPEEELCDDLDQLASALKSIQDVSPGSAREDLRQVRVDVEDAIADLQASAANVPEIQEVEDAIIAFRDAVEALPDNVTAGDAIRAVGTQVVDLSAALSSARDAVDCD